MSETKEATCLPDADGFEPYTNAMRSTFDSPTQRALDQLYTRFQGVEVSDMTSTVGSWCVRVNHVSEEGADPLPLAAIGKTPQQAAERLWRISTFFG